MAWIESHQELLDHPKVLGLASDMGWDRDLTIGRLHRFWWWCLDYATTGDLRRYNDAQIAMGAGVDASEGRQFVEAMKRSCWVDSEPYFRVHDWWDYAGKFLQVKWRNYPLRWKSVRASYACVDAEAVTEINEGNPKGVSKTVSNTSLPNLTLPNHHGLINISGGRYPTLDQVKARAAMAGVPESEAELFWNHFESVGWIDKNGHPVAKWENKLAVWGANAKEKSHKSGTAIQPRGTTAPNIFALKAQREAKEELARQIKTRYCSEVAMGESWNDEEQRKKYKGIMREINDITKRMASCH